MLLYIISQAVIPAKAGIQFRSTGFRVKLPGMTNKVKGHLMHCTKGKEVRPFQKKFRKVLTRTPLSFE
jgi:hypothetical protein